jgi:hypothetical protein
MTVMDSVLELTHKEQKDFLTSHGTPAGAERPGAYSLAPEHSSTAHRLARQHRDAHVGHDLLPRAFVVSLVSQYDHFLGGVLRCLYQLQPALLDSNEKNLTFSQIVKLGTLDAARDFLLEKEIEGLLRKSHSDQFTWLENKFAIPLRKDLSVWPAFVEVTERRNLFVHCDGVVSTQYLEVCRLHAVPLAPDIQPGTRLTVSPSYFKDAHRCIFEIGFKLAQVLWRKVLPSDLSHAEDNLTSVTYDLLTDQKYELAAILLDFACDTLKKHRTEQTRLICLVNRAIAYRFLKNEEKCKSILQAQDWSAAGDEFKLAVAVLEERYDDAAAIMRRMGPGGYVTKEFYHQWPLFRDFRAMEIFKDVYRELFGEDFRTITPPAHPEGEAPEEPHETTH